MKYRSRADIIAAVLGSMSSRNITLTRIMYGSFVSYVQAKEYLAFLEKKGLIRFDTASAAYGLTEEGVEVLGKLRDLGTILRIDEDEGPLTNSDRMGSFMPGAVMRSRRVGDKRELDSRPMT